MGQTAWSTRKLLRLVLDFDRKSPDEKTEKGQDQFLQIEQKRIIAVLKAFDMYVEPHKAPYDAVALFEAGNFILNRDKEWASKRLLEILGTLDKNKRPTRETVEEWLNKTDYYEGLPFRYKGKIFSIAANTVEELQNKYPNRRTDEQQKENYKREFIEAGYDPYPNTYKECVALKHIFSAVFSYRRKINELIDDCNRFDEISLAIINKNSLKALFTKRYELDNILLSLMDMKESILESEIIEKFGFPMYETPTDMRLTETEINIE